MSSCVQLQYPIDLFRFVTMLVRLCSLNVKSATDAAGLSMKVSMQVISEALTSNLIQV